jgi:hypothetical protein
MREGGTNGELSLERYRELGREENKTVFNVQGMWFSKDITHYRPWSDFQYCNMTPYH